MNFLFRAENGKPNFGSEHNLARFRQELADNEGKEFQVKRKEEKRTLSQNSYYWNYLSIIEFETGNIASELHEYFRRKLLSPKFIHIKGKGGVEEMKVPCSTTDLNKLQFGEYLDKISADCGVPLPNPEELAGYLPH